MNNNLPIFHGDDDDTDDDGDYSDDDEMFLNSLSTNQAECYPGYPETQGFLLLRIRIVSA